MKILLITETLLRNDNNVGNSYSNIFSEMENVKIDHICCQQGESQSDIIERSYQISERQIIQNIFHRSIQVGAVEEVGKECSRHSLEKKSSPKISGVVRKTYNLMRIFRFQIFFWIRDAIWGTGRWKSKQLREYLNEVKPDIIFAQLQDRIYLNKLIVYVKDYLKVPMVLYTWDDVYSLKQFSFSPFWWIDRFMQRRKIRSVVKRCDRIYTISKEQADEYEGYFHKKCRILYKGYQFHGDTPAIVCPSYPIKMVYTGNLYGGRLKTITLLCKEIHKLNHAGIKIQLYIYSATPLLKRQVKHLNLEKSTFFCGQITSEEVKRVQKTADILLHVEDFGTKGSLSTRLSFSTKIVDYFLEKKCIVAIGAERCSSIKYVERNDSAIIINNKHKIFQTLQEIADNPQIIGMYAQKAWDCGKRNHEIEQIQKKLYEDLNSVVVQSNKSSGK